MFYTFLEFILLKKVLLSLLLLYSTLGFIALPLLLKQQLIEQVQSLTKSKLTIDGVYFNPFLFKLTISDMKLTSLEGKPLVAFKSLLLDIELYSLLNSALHVKDFIITEPKISLVYNKDQTINLLNILKPQERTKEEKSDSNMKPPRIIIDNIAIERGGVSYEDFTLKEDFSFSFDELGFNLQNVDTNDFNSSDANLRFYSTLGDGGFVDFKTKVVGFKPLEVNGSFDFEASKLYSTWKYMKERLNLEVADGKISCHATYHLNLDDLNATTIENVNLSLDKLRVIPKNKSDDVLNLKSFYVRNATIKPFHQDVHVDKIGLEAFNVKAKRDKSGNIDWMEYAKVKQKEGAQDLKEQEPKSEKQAWNVVVDAVALEKISLDFEDSFVRPKVTSALNELNVYAQRVTLEGKEPFSYQINLLLNDAFKCKAHGDVIHNVLKANADMSCSGFDLARYRPYVDKAAKEELEVYDLALKSAIVGFDSHVEIKDFNDTMGLVVYDTDFNVYNFSLNKNSDNESLLHFKSFKVEGIALDTLKKSLNIQKTSLNGLLLNSARYKDGSINLNNLVVPKALTQKKQEATEEQSKPFEVSLNHFALNDATVDFNDKALTPSVRTKLDKTQLDAYDINLKEYSWLKYDFSTRLNSKGYIKSAGKLSHNPLKQEGTFELKEISLREFTPYVQEKAFLSVDDGKLSLQSKTSYSVSKNSPDLKVNGRMNLKDFFVNDSRDDSSLMSLNSLNLKSFTFELFPNRLYVDELDLNSFYVDAMIDKNKEMNFSKLVKPSNAKQSDENATVATLNDASKGPSFPVKILKVNVAAGNAKFADYSIPLKFKTNIHDLNGVIYSISNSPDETSYVDISGVVDEYGSTKLKGSVDSSNPKEYTDLDFNFKNLELSSMSGYSASFAGHEIDSGKLYLDLGYKIQKSQLLGKNSVIIKKIKLGKEVEDENVTVLPLGFVIALLEDSDGIIDMNMPVEGDLDKPDFKYGALVWKTLGNLITKAVTSPFRFLGSMMGLDGAELEFAEFEFASATILPTEREKLDNIAKMMTKRPKINLGLVPTYDLSSDKKALQRQKLAAMVSEKSGSKNETIHENAMTVETLESIYKDIKADNQLELLQTKLKEEHKDDTYERAYLNSLIELCSAIQDVSVAELEALATKRVDAIISYLNEEKNIDKSRFFNKETIKVNNPEESLVKLDLKVEVN